MEKAQENLSFKEKFAYSLGAIPNMFYTGLIGQIQAFYYAWMGLHPIYIIIAQIFYAVWNVINDPIFGYLQNRTRNKKGRYIPWIKWFSPLLSIALILVFFAPQQWRFAFGGEETQILLFLWYLITLSFYDLCYTIVILAHVALMPQITDNFGDRTQMAILKMIFSFLGIFFSYILPIVFLTNPTQEKIVALRISTFIFGGISIIPWAFLWTYVKERIELIPELQESFITNVKHVFRNPACRIYMIYDGISLGINQVVITSLTFFLAWTFGLDNPFATQSTDVITIIGFFIFPIIGAVVGIWIQMWIPKKKDLKTLLLLDFVFMAIGFLIAFFGALPSPIQSDIVYSPPPNRWIVSIGLGFVFMGFLGNMIYLDPLNSDVVDYDEFLTGNRRESVYSGINCIISKPMYSVVLAVFPTILAIYGLLPASPEDPTSSALVVASGFQSAITGVAIGSFLFPAILAIIGLITFIWYPLDRNKLLEIRDALSQKHAQQRLTLHKSN